MEIKLFMLSYALNYAKMINSFWKISKGERAIQQEHIFQVWVKETPDLSKIR